MLSVRQKDLPRIFVTLFASRKVDIPIPLGLDDPPGQIADVLAEALVPADKP